MPPPAPEVMMDLLLFLVPGVCAGLLAGLIRGSCCLIIMPVLAYRSTATELDPHIPAHLAVGTSLATSVSTSLPFVCAHHQLGAVCWRLFARMPLGSVFGSALDGLNAAAAQASIRLAVWRRPQFSTLIPVKEAPCCRIRK
ncbi:TSUP family transporter [Pseudomonas oryzihabitans]|uniref:TSUP family transporter n=1 Tax=Pseudomonas oryzihabitans TaxID=47885 RepID=UPI001F3FEF5C|nr:sulfite exporter TauE/SafE family protein [Pseudomonas oryzihabitans]